MNSERESLPRSVFASLCAVVLAAGMALPMLGATPSYAEEVTEPLVETAVSGNGNDVEGAGITTPPAEIPEGGVDKGTTLPSGTDSETQPPASNLAETYTVTFGTNAPQSVEKGGSATAPAMPDTTYSINGESVTAKFVGWYQTSSTNSFVPVEWPADVHFFEPDLVGSDKQNRGMFVNDRQRANLHVYPASSSIPVNGDMTFWALYTVPVNVVTLGVYEEGSFAMWFCANVITGDPLISDATWQWRGAGRAVEKWVFAKEAFDVNTMPITTDLVTPSREFDADGHPTAMVKVYLTANASGSSLGLSGSTGIAAGGNLKGTNIPENAAIYLGASSVSSGESYSDLISKIGNGILAGVYEVSLAVNGSLVHNEFGTLTLSFPIDAAYNGRSFIVHHRHNDGSITSEKVVAENGVVTVTVADLSAFALELEKLDEGGSSGSVTGGTALNTSTSALAKTGDPLTGITTAIVATLALGAVGFVGYRTRKSAKK